MLKENLDSLKGSFSKAWSNCNKNPKGDYKKFRNLKTIPWKCNQCCALINVRRGHWEKCISLVTNPVYHCVSTISLQLMLRSFHKNLVAFQLNKKHASKQAEQIEVMEFASDDFRLTTYLWTLD